MVKVFGITLLALGLVMPVMAESEQTVASYLMGWDLPLTDENKIPPGLTAFHLYWCPGPFERQDEPGDPVACTDGSPPGTAKVSRPPDAEGRPQLPPTEGRIEFVSIPGMAMHVAVEAEYSENLRSLLSNIVIITEPSSHLPAKNLRVHGGSWRRERLSDDPAIQKLLMRQRSGGN